MPRLAVTGANGFVGRHLVSQAAAEGWEVVGIVRSEAGAAVVRQAGGRPVRLAAFEAALLAPALAGADALVHLAHIGSERDGATYDTVNVDGTRQAVEAASPAGVPRVVMLSGLGVARYGMAPRSTNRYFLSKLRAEAALFASDREAVVLRPSYVVGPRDGFVTSLLGQMAEGRVDQPGDGGYRLQPIAVKDAAEAILAGCTAPLLRRSHAPGRRVFDLVGPEPVSFREFVERLGRAAAAQGRAQAWSVREVPLHEVDAQAAAGGWRGMPSDELDCLLCDEVSDPRPLEALLGRFLTPLEAALATAVRGTPPVSGGRG